MLVRFRFPGRNLLSTIVDLPFAIPTLVTGVALVALYGPNAPIGGLFERLGIHVIFAPLGIVLALLFITLPFVIRTVQPVLLELDPAEEEAVGDPRGQRVDDLPPGRAAGASGPPSRPARCCRSPGRPASSAAS